MSFIATLGAWISPPDPRPTRAIEDEIAEELEFHLALSTEEGIEAGLSPGEARETARARFGDVERIRRDCRRMQIGDRVMLQRINAVAVVLLLVAVVALGWRSLASEARSEATIAELRADVKELTRALGGGEVLAAEPVRVSLGEGALEEALRRRVDPTGHLGAEVRREDDGYVVEMPGAEIVLADEPGNDPDAWLARFRSANGWRAGLALGNEIAKLPADHALDLMRAIYARIPDVEHRQQVLKPFVFHGGHVHAVEVLHLAATDPELDVQTWAFGYLKDYAYRDFSADYTAYLEWYDRFGGRPLNEILEGSADELVGRLRAADDAELARELVLLELDLRPGAVAGVDLARVLRELGALAVARRGLAAPEPRTRAAALRFAAALGPDEAFLRGAVVPALESESDAELLAAGARALGASGEPWTVEPLIDLARRRLATGADGVVFAVGRALAELGDPRAIPSMIGLIAADDGYWSVYGLGHFGLAPLTGVDYDESHDGAWWTGWWEKNHGRLPASVRDLPLPTFVLR